MILNIINKKLTSTEKEKLNSLSSIIKVVNLDSYMLNDDIKIHLNDIEKDEREILIDANDCLGVVFWGFPQNDDYTKKVFHSLLERENVYFAAFDEEDIKSYETIKKDLPSLFQKLVINYLCDTFDEEKRHFTIEEITKAGKKSTNSLVAGVSEIYNNRHMIGKMAHSIFQQETLKTTLGSYWHIVRDIVFFITYVMFMLFMRGSGEVEGIPVIMYLVSGLVAWYYISDILGGGATCIKASKGIISKVKFPVTIIPIYHSIAIFYRRGLTYIILAAVVLVYVITDAPGVEVHPIKFAYYTFAMFVCMVGFSILFSALVAISRDFHELYKSFIRIQMYFNPIFWDISSVQNKLAGSSSSLVNFIEVPFNILMLNPSIYILTGYRESFGSVRTNTLETTLVFWGIVVLMYLVGFKLQARVRSLYADII